MALFTAALPPSFCRPGSAPGWASSRSSSRSSRGDLREVRRAPELLRAEAFGHLACELRDVTLLSCPDELSLLHAERLQLGCNGWAAFRIPLDPRHVPTLCGLTSRSRWVKRYGCSLGQCSEMSPEHCRGAEVVERLVWPASAPFRASGVQGRSGWWCRSQAMTAHDFADLFDVRRAIAS